MANFFDQFDGASAAEITPTKRALLNSIAAGEAPDYNTVYGGGRFEEMNDHPRRAVPIRSGPNAGRTSSAAGRYQFLGSTWDEAKSALGLTDFSPNSQDRAAAWLAERDYKKRTGRDLWADVEAGKEDPQKLNYVGSALSKTWTSLPGGIEPNGATSGFARRMTDEFSSQSRQPQAAGEPMLIAPTQGAPVQPVSSSNFFDQFDGAPAQAQVEGPPAPQPSMLQKALAPITSYPETYQGMRKEGAQQLETGVDQMRNAASGEDAMGYPVDRAWEAARGAGNAAFGGIGYLASPINAALRTFAGKPIEENTGIPKEYTEFATSLAIPGLGMTKVSSVQKPARVLAPGEKVVESGQNLKNVGAGGAVEIPRAVATDNMAAQRTAAAVGNVPIAGNPIVKASDKTVSQLTQKAQDVASEYGSSSVLTGGEEASQSIKNWITGESAATSKKFYDKVDSLINPQVATDLAHTRNAADSILARRANAAITEDSRAVQKIKEAIDRPGGLNYEGIKDLRTFIGELKDKPHLLPADISGKELGKIYGALSEDLAKAVKNAGGPQAEVAFQRANNHYRLVSERREALAKIVGADGNVSAEQVFERIVTMAGNTSRADMNKLAQARKAMGAQSWNEVASGLISRMGRSEDATGNVIFSPQKFLTAYQDKLSGQGRAMLFRSAGKENIAPFLDDIATITGRFRQLQRFSNPSGTGQTVAGSAGLAGLFLEPMTAIGAAVGTNVLARVLATPATVAPAAQWSRKYSIAVSSPTPANVAQLTIASRNLANTINSQFGSSLSGSDFLKAIQGAIPARADKENPEPVRGVNQ